MYVALLQYTAPTEEVVLFLPSHSEWINQHYRSGDFIAAGRRQPRGAGIIIIARNMLRSRLSAILATDPLATHHMVRSEVLEFQALHTIPELAQYADMLNTGHQT